MHKQSVWDFCKSSVLAYSRQGNTKYSVGCPLQPTVGDPA